MALALNNTAQVSSKSTRLSAGIALHPALQVLVLRQGLLKSSKDSQEQAPSSVQFLGMSASFET
jgi:hypothetical protein